MSFGPFGSRLMRGPLASTLVVAAVTGLFSLGLVHYLAQVVEPAGARRARLAGAVAEPQVTGSIGTAARSVVLDPCTGRERLVVRGP